MEKNTIIPDNQQLWTKVCSFQNLRSAWNKVNANKGAPGIDHITLEDFNQNLDENLKTLQDQLEKNEYKPLPVLRIYIDKDDQTKRPIGISAIRDRIIQQSLHLVISPIFEQEFLDCSFAYRPRRSTHDAISQIETLLNDGLIWVLDGDIEKFFDTIDHDLLLSYITEQISDTRVLKLIEELLKTGVFENMTISEEYIGISQGSVISPLLANIYLHQFDKQINKKGYHLIRYADDFIILEQTQEMIARALADITTILQTLKLNLNEKKTRLIHAENGFVFLGYYIDINGKGPSKKAIGAITRKLDEIISSGKRRSIDERITDLEQSIKSWTNYFHTCRGIDPQNEVILIALIEMSLELGDDEYAVKLISKRKNFSINEADIWYRLGTLVSIPYKRVYSFTR